MHFFLTLLITLGVAHASTDAMDAFDKSHPRDNTFCSLKGKRVELMIRGMSKYTEPSERGYGEFLFYRHPLKKARFLKMNSFGSDTYTFFKGVSPICSKSHGYQMDQNTLAILLLKENKPFKNKLVIAQFDAKTLEPKDIIETNYLTDQAKKSEIGFIFRTFSEKYNAEIGRVAIDGQNYIFQEKDFPQWIEYSSDGFILKPDLTYSKFPWKKLFKDQKEFEEAAHWDGASKKFMNNVIYVAVSHKLKKQCLLFLENKLKLVGTEAWRCHAI